MVNTRRAFIFGFAFCFVLVACSAASFRYYGLEGVSYQEGKLLGPKPKDDLPFSMCAPTAAVRNPCVVLFATEFFALKQDYLDTKQKLKECQKP